MVKPVWPDRSRLLSVWFCYFYVLETEIQFLRGKWIRPKQGVRRIVYMDKKNASYGNRSIVVDYRRFSLPIWWIAWFIAQLKQEINAL